MFCFVLLSLSSQKLKKEKQFQLASELWKGSFYCGPSDGIAAIFFSLSCILYFLVQSLLFFFSRPTEGCCLRNPLVLHADGMLTNSLLCILARSGQICDIVFSKQTRVRWLVGPDENWVTKLKKIFLKHY